MRKESCKMLKVKDCTDKDRKEYDILINNKLVGYIQMDRHVMVIFDKALEELGYTRV
jgi:hypothetical protein